jgi:hypothetical protein
MAPIRRDLEAKRRSSGRSFVVAEDGHYFVRAADDVHSPNPMTILIVPLPDEERRAVG